MLIPPPSFLHMGEESLLVNMVEMVGYYSMVRYCMSAYTVLHHIALPPMVRFIYCILHYIILTTQLTAESTVSGNKLTTFTGKNSLVS